MKLPEQTLYIDGGYVDAGSGETFETINPATGEVLATVQHAGPEDVDRAIKSARTGFETWRRKPRAICFFNVPWGVAAVPPRPGSGGRGSSP